MELHDSSGCEAKQPRTAATAQGHKGVKQDITRMDVGGWRAEEPNGQTQ